MLRADYELTASEVQLLSSRDALATFFARLGYDTNARLGVRQAENDLAEKIQTMYSAALEKVLPLKETLARTDRLIDQIVYRLYSQTEEEIAVVKSR